MLARDALEQAEFELNMMVGQSGMELSIRKDDHRRGNTSEPMLAQAFAAHHTWKHAHGIVKDILEGVDA
jgi:hypothetical protein